MKPVLRWLGLAALFVVIGHLAVIIATPYVLMSLAMNRFSQQGHTVNQFVYSSRVTENSRAVVRPSPDLAYAACVYDLAKGPLRVHGAPSHNYMSISVFQANSDNIFVVNDRQAPTGVDFVLAKVGQATPLGAKVVVSPSAKGVILDRRLAPSEDAFTQADQARRGDVCQSIGPPAT